MPLNPRIRRWQGQVVWLVGASTGIGRATAELLHARGATVVDWNRQTGRPDNARVLLRYDQARFHGLIRDALAAG